MPESLRRTATDWIFIVAACYATSHSQCNTRGHQPAVWASGCGCGGWRTAVSAAGILYNFSTLPFAHFRRRICRP